jgi:hypothetical protein
MYRVTGQHGPANSKGIPMHRSLHKMLLTPALAAVVILGLITPAAADEQVRPADVDSTDVRPVKRPDVRPDVRPDIAVLNLECEGRRSDDGNLGAVCRWSSTDIIRAYQLWRIVNRGHRELVGSYDNSTNIVRDDVPDDAHLVRYAVLGLNGDREIVARSRVEHVRFRQAEPPVVDRPTDEVIDRPMRLRRHRRPIHLLPV